MEVKIKLGNDEEFKKTKPEINKTEPHEVNKQISSFKIETNGASYFVNGFNRNK